MKERPIVFTGESVQAILAGRKTQTRRVITFPAHAMTPDAGWIKSIYPDGHGDWIAWSGDRPGLAEYTKKAYPAGGGIKCPYGQPGDLLWVRETVQLFSVSGIYGSERNPEQWTLRYKAGGIKTVNAQSDGGWTKYSFTKWRPSIFMPRWASRLTLRITGVRVEQVQEISRDDVLAEGIHRYTFARGVISDNPPDPRWKFIELWDTINAKRGYPWVSNPWVWVVEFEVIK